MTRAINFKIWLRIVCKFHGCILLYVNFIPYGTSKPFGHLSYFIKFTHNSRIYNTRQSGKMYETERYKNGKILDFVEKWMKYVNKKKR